MATHYETLGINETASADEIKAAYRKLAMQWHPDRNSGNKDAEVKFKEISAAYEILSDEIKRREYDQTRKNPFHGNHGGVHWNVNVNGRPFDNPTNIDDFVAQFFSQHGFPGFGRAPQRNRDVNLNINISLEDSYNGKQIPLGFTTNSGRKIDLVIDIPKGIDNGTRIRYAGQGDHSNTSLPPGDLYIHVEIAPHAKFVRHGNHLEHHCKVDAISAIVGTKLHIYAINGHKISVTIPPGTQHGTKLRIVNQGMPLREHPGTHGDLYLIIELEIPQNLSAENLSLLSQIQKNRSIDNH